MDEELTEACGSAEQPGAPNRSRVTRRKFIGAMGAGAAAAALLQRGTPASAQQPAQAYYYQDSFGSVVPAGQGAIQLGVYPPTPTSGQQAPGAPDAGCQQGADGTTFYNCDGYPQYHILLIMVDQMRNPAFWLPSGNSWISSYNNSSMPILPNIAGLAQKSFTFPNYWVAATVCGPSRACLLTGLYTQQTCIFKSGSAGSPAVQQTPPLLPYNVNWQPTGANNVNPGFATIGNVLGQSLPVGNNDLDQKSYDCTWIGKWHVSCDTGKANNSIPGSHGPSDYGFNPTYSIPNAGSGVYPAGANGYPSPNGAENEGTAGDFLNSNNTSDRHVPNFLGSSPFSANATSWPQLIQLNDAAIASAFTSEWLPYATASRNNAQLTPCFCAVSFINPHDIGDFPHSYGLNSSNATGWFGNASSADSTYFEAPPTNTSQTIYYGNNCGNNNACGAAGDVTTIASFLPNNSSGAYPNLPPGAGNGGPWNFENIAGMPYSNHNNSAKPGLQRFFLQNRDEACGNIASPGSYNNGNNGWATPGPWQTFLNYYMWMQSCVDYQIGQVLGTNPTSNNGLAQSPDFANQTVIIFTSDHGDYGGSHSLHAKGGGLYEEVMNVPLFVSFPSMRNNSSLPAGPFPLPYVCSSVDILPFLYSLALGNQSWRNNSNDMIYYLAGREAIVDAIYQYSNNNNNTTPLKQHRISSVPLYQGVSGCSVGNTSCEAWQIYQPFVLHTADDFSAAAVGGNYEPSHAIAFRTVDITDPNNNSAPFFNQATYGGGKLGIYSFWDTCHQGSAPIMGLDYANAPNQYEFYNYSVHPYNTGLTPNLAELGNQYFDANNDGNPTSEATLYYNGFYNNSSPGISVQGELYNLNNTSAGNNVLQVAAAVQVAFQNYIAYLNCANNLTGNNSNGPVTVCSEDCPNCSAGSCPPIYDF